MLIQALQLRILLKQPVHLYLYPWYIRIESFLINVHVFDVFPFILFINNYDVSTITLSLHKQ